MPNALSAGTSAAPQAALPGQPIGNVLAAQQPQQGALPGAAGAPQAPAVPQVTHQQAVAGLRHFSAIARQLEQILKDPDLGKADLQSKIIDGTTHLVASRIITPGDAVQQLSTVPSDPQMQRKWVQQHFQQTMLAMNALLDHHAQSNPGSGDLPTEIARSTSNGPEAHLEDMKSLNGGYRSAQRG